ncbi:MAG TPA: type II toxin-antitoxin system PrlF family antitoxin [Candidatus Baltobacteraceae bacterium]|jgi:hypothetical protein|nr:type II toxin-antitoxin system PrlF family antitoxin [Candidatus Baltobacteraceae bacterium]
MNSKVPAFEAFLQVLADDITKHPEHLQSLDVKFAARIRSAVSGVVVDLDAELSAEGE